MYTNRRNCNAGRCWHYSLFWRCIFIFVSSPPYDDDFTGQCIITGWKCNAVCHSKPFLSLPGSAPFVVLMHLCNRHSYSLSSVSFIGCCIPNPLNFGPSRSLPTIYLSLYRSALLLCLFYLLSLSLAHCYPWNSETLQATERSYTTHSFFFELRIGVEDSWKYNTFSEKDYRERCGESY